MGAAPGGSRGLHKAAGARRGRCRGGLWLGPLLAALFVAESPASIELVPHDADLAAVVLSETQRGRPGWALRTAQAAIAAGDRAGAEAQLEGIAERFPVIADYADLLRLRLYIDAGDHAGAVAFAAAWRYGDSPLAAERDALVGTAQAALGDRAAARAAWTRAAEGTTDGAQLAALHWQIAESFAADGDLGAAVERYLKVWTAHPLEPESKSAAAALDAIAERRGADPRTGRELRRRGDTLYVRRHNEAALAAYDEALASPGISAIEARRARQKRAQTLFRLRRYPEAVEAFGKVAATPDNRIERARAIARAGEVERGARDLEAIGRSVRGRPAARALYLAGLLWEGEGEEARGRALFKEVVRAGGKTSYANASLWRFAWADFRAGRYKAAIANFKKLLANDRDGIPALRTRYWLARAYERSGAHAAPAFAAIAREFPFSYYGWRAGLRAGAGNAAVRARPIDPGAAVFGPADISRPQILLEAGLAAEARRELDRLYPRAEGLGDLLALSSLYADSGDFHSSQRVIVRAYNESLARGPVPAQLDLWWHAWPAPFAAGMRRATADGALIEPGLVYALMREESGYRPEVVSVAGARGLLQIMPETGERLARDVALGDFDAGDLFDPDVNLRLGSHYLRSLLDRFGGRTSAAVASYNAGPAAVSGWLDPAIEDDEWVESIPYEQTRSYVKRVLRSLYAYRVLY
jgi:soluble lytic murein transglycosylase